MCNSPHESVKYDLSFQYVVQMMSQVIGVAGSNPVWGYHIPSDRQFSSNFDFWVSNDPNEIPKLCKIVEKD